MHRAGHQLDYKSIGNEMIGTCQCGQWQVALPAPDGADLLSVISETLRQHQGYLDGLDSARQNDPDQ
jgi:hypothetical protein